MDRNYVTSGALDAAEIKRIRNELCMTQKEFAELLNVSVKSVERWEISKKPVTGAAAALIRLHDMNRYLNENLIIPERTPDYPLRFYYKYYDTICTVIDVNQIQQRVRIKNYTRNLLYRAFGRNESPTYKEYEEFLESRCFPRERDKMKLMLKALDIPFYDPLMIIRKTEGRLAEDYFSLEIVKP